MSFDAIYGLLDAASERERDRIGEQLKRIDRQLEDREEIHVRNVAELEEELEEAREDLAAFTTRSFYDEAAAQRERERLEERVAELRQQLRRERRARWENHQNLRREKRDLVRELEEVEDDGEVLTYLDRV